MVIHSRYCMILSDLDSVLLISKIHTIYPPSHFKAHNCRWKQARRDGKHHLIRYCFSQHFMCCIYFHMSKIQSIPYSPRQAGARNILSCRNDLEHDSKFDLVTLRKMVQKLFKIIATLPHHSLLRPNQRLLLLISLASVGADCIGTSGRSAEYFLSKMKIEAKMMVENSTIEMTWRQSGGKSIFFLSLLSRIFIFIANKFVNGKLEK